MCDLSAATWIGIGCGALFILGIGFCIGLVLSANLQMDLEDERERHQDEMCCQQPRE